MHARGAALALLLGALVPTGCGQEDEPELPAGCRSSAEEVRAALGRAPERVRIDGAPLSSCLARESDVADLQLVGATYLRVVTDLTPGARRDPAGQEALRLGYLMGAVRRGSERTQGIHVEVVRRLEQELEGIDQRDPAFKRGERAGRTHG